MTTTVASATENQVNFLLSLVAQRENGLEYVELWMANKAITHPSQFDRAAISIVIDGLKHLPRKEQAPAAQAAPVELQDGMYRIPTGGIYKVQHAVHGSGKQYAKLLTPPVEGASKWTFEYAPGAIRFLTVEHRMTLEQAKEFGALYGTCCVCGAVLTNERSIEAGIGPICGGRI